MGARVLPDCSSVGDGQWPPDVAGVDGTDQQEALGPSRVYMRLCVCVCVTVSRLLHTHTPAPKLRRTKRSLTGSRSLSKEQCSSPVDGRSLARCWLADSDSFFFICLFFFFLLPFEKI